MENKSEAVAREIVECKKCDGKGWYVISELGQNGEPQQAQQQCEDCYYGTGYYGEDLVRRISTAIEEAEERGYQRCRHFYFSEIDGERVKKITQLEQELSEARKENEEVKNRLAFQGDPYMKIEILEEELQSLRKQLASARDGVIEECIKLIECGYSHTESTDADGNARDIVQAIRSLKEKA